MYIQITNLNQSIKTDTLMAIKSIDEVISTLENIIKKSQTNNDPLGYFAALYLKVTKKVKEGIDNNFFDDNKRMEKLDIIFASRYLDAYFAWQEKEKVTSSWEIAFEYSTHYWPIVLEHLLLGMNAHISLDLGIAAAQVSEGKNIDDLQNDFNKINEILSSLVDEVENELAEIWPTFKLILKWTKMVDNYLVDFSMKLARDGAWSFAKKIADHPESELESLIEERDQKVANNSRIVTNPGFIVTLIFGVIRIGERGTVAEKIEEMK
jgi:hypothetical protein